MKILLGSDLHLEFGDLDITNEQGADVLILSGDILIAQDLHDHSEESIRACEGVGMKLGSRQKIARRFRGFLDRASSRFPHVIYIAGNHEFYHGKFYSSLDDLHNEASKFHNIYFLEDQTKVIDDVTFIGCTLWTDMNKFDPLTMHTLPQLMYDYSVIRDDKLGHTKLKPATAYQRHKQSVKFIGDTIDNDPDGKYVVVTHMAPSHLSVHPMYHNDKLMNGGYASDLSDLILDHPQIKLWTHGHTHHPFDYMIGDTRIVCNPRGYVGHEPQAATFKLKYLEI